MSLIRKILSLKQSDKLFIFFITLMAFFVSAEYGVTRPASTSIFISLFSSKMFPYAWILGVPLNLTIVYLYNRFLPTYGCLKTFFYFVLSVMTVNSLTGLFVHQYPWLIFVQFIFKDVYILLAFKQMWSMIHSTIDTKRAKYLYGVMFGMGGIGSVFGGVISGFSAVKLGSDFLLLFTAPFYLIILFLYSNALKSSGVKDQEKDFKEHLIDNHSNPKEGFLLFKKSPILVFILLIVVSMQLFTALIDYQYNIFLEKYIPNLDLRTQFAGKLTILINSISTCFQFFGGFLLIHYLGIKRSHYFVPILLGINSMLLLIFPSFSVAIYCFTSIKSIDYSFFGIIREMFYIPLKINEKYRAKAIIDVFAYRSAKAFASLFLILAQSLVFLNISIMISIISVVIAICWIKIISLLFKYKKENVEFAN